MWILWITYPDWKKIVGKLFCECCVSWTSYKKILNCSEIAGSSCLWVADLNSYSKWKMLWAIKKKAEEMAKETIVNFKM